MPERPYYDLGRRTVRVLVLVLVFVRAEGAIELLLPRILLARVLLPVLLRRRAVGNDRFVHDRRLVGFHERVGLSVRPAAITELLLLFV